MFTIVLPASTAPAVVEFPIVPDYVNDEECYFYGSPDFLSRARADFLLAMHSTTWEELFKAEEWLREAHTDSGWRTNQLAYALGY